MTFWIACNLSPPLLRRRILQPIHQCKLKNCPIVLLTSVSSLLALNSSPPSTKPSSSPSTKPTSTPSVHPFRGYEWVGQGECADLNGDVFSWAQFTNTAYSIPNVEKCAHMCEALDTTGQVGIGYWDNILCRCYFDGNAPAESHEAASFGQHVGSGPIGGVSAGDHWHCYRRIVSLQHFGSS